MPVTYDPIHDETYGHTENQIEESVEFLEAAKDAADAMAKALMPFAEKLGVKDTQAKLASALGQYAEEYLIPDYHHHFSIVNDNVVDPRTLARAGLTSNFDKNVDLITPLIAPGEQDIFLKAAAQMRQIFQMPAPKTGGEHGVR